MVSSPRVDTFLAAIWPDDADPISVPWAVWGFFKLITPFIDPLTREKMKFNEDLRKHVPTDQLWSKMGGDVEFEYDHSVYWPAVVSLAAERKQAYRERWVQGGKKLGESEEYLKGGGSGDVNAGVDVLTKQTSAGVHSPSNPGAEGVTQNGIPNNSIPNMSGLTIGS